MSGGTFRTVSLLTVLGDPNIITVVSTKVVSYGAPGIDGTDVSGGFFRDPSGGGKLPGIKKFVIRRGVILIKLSEART
jgi:hypothetical protein